MGYWVYNPHTGGKKIPEAVQIRIRERILRYAGKNYKGKYDRIDVRFRGALCYIDAYVESQAQPTHLCRIRYNCDENRWSLAFYTYSHEKYEPSLFMSGEDHGTPEEAFDIGSLYLQ